MKFARRTAFSLVELLVVIGIIGLLAAILIPTVSMVRKSAHEAATKATISALSSAIEQYHTAFRAYPGAWSNQAIIGRQVTINSGTGAITFGGGGNVTMTESLTLALLGGLTLEGTTIEYQSNLLESAAGPEVLNSRTGKRYSPFIQVKPGMLSKGVMSDLPNDVGVLYATAGRTLPEDSHIPEFLDSFPDAMPIIYLRATVSARGIVNDGTLAGDFQYDIREVRPYLPNTNATAFVTLGPWNPANEAGRGTKATPYQGFEYFRHPQLGGALSAGGNADGTPRQKDTFILISAGKDRIFGTRDDVTNFGPLVD